MPLVKIIVLRYLRGVDKLCSNLIMQKPTYLIASLVFSVTVAQAQPREESRNWTSFYQTVDAFFVKKETKFRLIGSAKVITEDTLAWAGLWTYVANEGDEGGFFDNMYDRKIQTNEWHSFVIDGELDANADVIYFGGLCMYNGQFYFDDFRLFVENEHGKLEPVVIDNAGFEKEMMPNNMVAWTEGGYSGDVRIKEFTITASDDRTEGDQALLITGSGTEQDSTYLIGPAKGFSPQIGTLVMMLNNLSKRVETTVGLLNQQETDFLLDEKANSVGALIMHLAAAEAYYQVFTFEGRGFNDEEKEKWQVALDLGAKAREKFTGKPIEHYLAIYQEVRQKTIDELRKRDDAWLAKVQPAYGANNHWSWFHVMEHQSSHLGQILMLKKRFPKDDEVAKQSIDTDY